ncbi:MAG: hypothetical protein NVS2B3_10060 [Vulcanimicrobiaceae bacterium]
MSARGDPAGSARAFNARAVLASEHGERLYLRIIARCVLAAHDERGRSRLFREAATLGARLESATMRSAVRALLEGDEGARILARFVLRSEATERTGTATDVRVFAGEVRVGGAVQALSRSEFAVLVALARRARCYSAVELGDLLYPELDADNAANRVHVYIHRLRLRLGRDVVVADDTGYRLGPLVDVDLWDLAALDADPQRPPSPGERADARLRSLEAISPEAFEAFALRLRLPETIVCELRDALERYRMLANVDGAAARARL